MTGPSPLPAPKSRRPWLTHAMLPGVMEIGIAILLALNLKLIYDTHRLTDRDLKLTADIANVVRERNEREVTDCDRQVPQRAEIRRLERRVGAISDPGLRSAFRDYLSEVEGNIREQHECDELAEELGVTR